VADVSSTCRTLYEQIEAATLESGLDAEQVLLSAGRYRERRAGRDFVTPNAYKPTGAALGSPLPEEGACRRLWLVAEELARFLHGARSNAGSFFAFVPAHSYHITVVNRGHFDTSEVVSLDQSMRARLARVVQSYPAIALDIDGVAITKQGRVLAKCIPRNDDLALLREHVVSQIPELAENTPRTAHIKLGHVLLPLTAEETSALVAFAKSFDDAIRGALLFSDLFTPAGRVPLAAVCSEA
jgi:2'-5' RNA ligase